eukprot:3642211-Rhodomonas_salina.5
MRQRDWGSYLQRPVFWSIAKKILITCSGNHVSSSCGVHIRTLVFRLAPTPPARPPGPLDLRSQSVGDMDVLARGSRIVCFRDQTAQQDRARILGPELVGGQLAQVGEHPNGGIERDKLLDQLPEVRSSRIPGPDRPVEPERRRVEALRGVRPVVQGFFAARRDQPRVPDGPERIAVQVTASHHIGQRPVSDEREHHDPMKVSEPLDQGAARDGLEDLKVAWLCGTSQCQSEKECSIADIAPPERTACELCGRWHEI